MKQPITIALDAMGGDHGPDVVVPAACAAVEGRQNLSLVLVGDAQRLQASLRSHDAASHPRLEVQQASQVVAMDEAPAQALRGKKDSSMRVAINLVKSGEAHACISAGNTGALMAIARFVLRTLPGIKRPAICTALPSQRGHTLVLDLGANVDSKAEHLVQFALMGTELARAVDDKPRPRVALLNVGEEEIKGNEQVKDAAALLAATDLNYIGYAEGDAIYTGDADVIVCDGFAGNVALKSSEGVARMIRGMIHEEFGRNLLTRLMGAITYPVLARLGRRIDPRRYNGASLLGLQGIVIKSHGGADAVAFEHAIEIGAREVEKNVPDRIRVHLERLQQQEQSA